MEKKQNQPYGVGRKRPQLDLPVEKIFLDSENPRLGEDMQSKDESELLRNLHRDFDLRELAESMSQNGYFDEEPLIVIPKDIPEKFKKKSYDELNKDEDYLKFINNETTKFIVVEGNRRLATIKLLLSQTRRDSLKIKEWPSISQTTVEDLKKVPSIVYPTREEVVPYLGVRHITGIKKWEPYAKARYIASMVNKGFTIDNIQKIIGDVGQATLRSYVCYKLIDIMEEEEAGSGEKAKSYFSYLLLSIGQGSIKEFLGLPRKLNDIDVDDPIKKENIKNLKLLFSFLFGEGKEKSAVIKESRDITGKLTHVINKQESTTLLTSTRDLDAAYARSDGEEGFVIKQLSLANRTLETVLGIVHRHKTKEIETEVVKCKDTMTQILKILKE